MNNLVGFSHTKLLSFLTQKGYGIIYPTHHFDTIMKFSSAILALTSAVVTGKYDRTAKVFLLQQLVCLF